MKTCTWCKVEKDESEYNKKKGGAGGLSAHCRECQRKRHNERYAPAKPHLKYYSEHYDELKEKRDAMRDELNERSRKYNRECKDKKREVVLRSRNKHLESHRKRATAYAKSKYDNDPLYRTKQNLRSLIFSAFVRLSKNGKLKTNKEYGIDFNAIFAKVGERPGNGREYHLDHIIPLAAFDFDNEEHVRLSQSPCNLRWVSRKENLCKSDSIPDFAYSDPELLNILKIIGKVNVAS